MIVYASEPLRGEKLLCVKDIDTHSKGDIRIVGYFSSTYAEFDLWDAGNNGNNIVSPVELNMIRENFIKYDELSDEDLFLLKVGGIDAIMNCND